MGGAESGEVGPPRGLPLHDLGGQSGYGPVPYQVDEPAFHADWERRVFGLMGQALRRSATRPGEFRYAIERLAATDYFDHGYYGRWEAAFEVVLEEYGVIPRGAVDQRLDAPDGTGPSARVRGVIERDPDALPPDRPTPAPQGRTVRRALSDRPRFAPGDRVVASPGPADGGHTRLAGYVVGRRGTVVRLHPAEVLPDSSAHDLGERPQHVYCVAYDSAELWGPDAESATIHIDLYESYLDADQDQEEQ